jgi:RNA recognition motif-containing protein
MNIYISGLSFNASEESLEELFAGYGEVTSAKIIKDKFTGNSRGFAFVEMSSDADGQKAIDELNDTEFKGKNISVNVARPRTERSNRGGGGFNNRRY